MKYPSNEINTHNALIPPITEWGRLLSRHCSSFDFMLGAVFNQGRNISIWHKNRRRNVLFIKILCLHAAGIRSLFNMLPCNVWQCESVNPWKVFLLLYKSGAGLRSDWDGETYESYETFITGWSTWWILHLCSLWQRDDFSKQLCCSSVQSMM